MSARIAAARRRVAARRLIDQLEYWCAGFGLATSHLIRSDLSEESRQALAHLERMAAVGL
jgi:hypothetical protein